MSLGVTPRMELCLGAIRDLTVDGVPPSISEIGSAIGAASKSEVHRLIHRLKERGKIDFLPRQSRSIRLVEEEIDVRTIQGMSDEALRRLIALTSGILAAREGGGGLRPQRPLDASQTASPASRGGA